MSLLIAEVAEKVCRAAADAVYRYAAVTGLSPGEDLPERFVTAFVLDRVGDELTLTLETSLRKLWIWHRHAVGFPIAELDDGLPPIAAILGSPRVDMVVWSSEKDKQKDEQGCFAILEFKNWKILEKERDKIFGIV